MAIGIKGRAMSDILMCLLAFMVIATCARSDVASGFGCILTIVFAVVMVTVLIVGAVLGMVVG